MRRTPFCFSGTSVLVWQAFFDFYKNSMVPNHVNIAEKYSLFSETWSPRIVGDLNENYIKIARLQDDFVWHSHEHEDELFVVYKGTLCMDFRDGRTVEVQPGEILIVPKGVEHRPYTRNGEEVWAMLVEPKSTLHTGTTNTEKTVAVEAQQRI